MITETARAAAAPVAAAARTGPGVDHAAFLKLLVAQLRSQDPTKPMESETMLSQLASFSAVEQAVATNERLESLLGLVRLGGSASLVGQTYQAADGSPAARIDAVEFAEAGVFARLADGRTVPLDGAFRIGREP